MDHLSQVLAYAAQGGTPADTPPQGGSPMLIMMVAIFIVFYFLMIRGPQKKEQQRRDQMFRDMAKGDSVVTTGGIYGSVESVDNDSGVVTVTIAPKVTVKIAKNSIHAVTEKKGAKSAQGPGAATPEPAGKA